MIWSCYIVSSIDFCPNGNASDVYRCQKRRCIFRISCRYTSPTLQFQKRIFHKMPKPIQVVIVVAGRLTIPAWGNNWRNSFFHKFFHKCITVISFVRQQILRVHPFNKFASL